MLSHLSARFKVWAVKKKKKSFVRVSQSWGGIWMLSCYLKANTVSASSCTLNQEQRGFMQSTPSEFDSPAHIWIIYSDARWLNKGSLFIPGDTQFDGLFVGFLVLLHIFQPPWNSPAVSGGVGAIFLAPDHRIPSARWSLLINHVTMFHNLGITASMSLITICALLKPKSSQTAWLRWWKQQAEVRRKVSCIQRLKSGPASVRRLTPEVLFHAYGRCASHLLRQLQWLSGYQVRF